MPGTDDADARGCVPGEPPCAESGEVCDEEEDSCDACSPDTWDRDEDGERAVACGGADCDDADPAVNPGAEEICDAEGRDEDCDPETFGPPGPSGVAGDADGDSYVSAMCCQQIDGAVTCGPDCNDANMEINPDASEICNGLDDDCDGSLDPTIEDRDMDGWAGCSDLPAAMRDCDDESDVTHPGASELCDGEDNDCDGDNAGEDLDGDGFLAVGASCSGGPRDARPRTDCDDDDIQISPTAMERCDATDWDCDGDTDEAPASNTCGSDAITTYACTSESCEVASCAATHDDCDGMASNGCEQSLDTPAHCGACDNACQWVCSAMTCDDPVDVTVGGYHVCARTSNERIRCWGRNEDGQLGLGATSVSPSTHPAGYVQATIPGAGVVALTTVEEVEAGGFFSCARVSSGNVYCWGRNDHGQLGNGAPGPDVAVAETHVSDASSLAISESHACAIVNAPVVGSVVCWGNNDRYQSATVAPSAVPGTAVASDVAVGLEHSCSRTTDGRVQCWGDNNYGQIGQGSTDVVPEPANFVENASGSGDLNDVEDISAAGYITCALHSTGRMSCWGANTTRPVTVTDGGSPATFTAFVGEGNDPFRAVCARNASGDVRCISTSSVGSFVAGSTAGSPASSVTSFSASEAIEGVSYGHICVIDGAGLRCLGSNSYGEVGDGTRLERRDLVTVLPPS
ncbi:MAG TPA: MopE-related protein [Sandaracinaceae bacterium LLY-WYZ-13_1]|nr:MopE-related protein [Sandaracinaceae bacterium LLY-WYZ-13_1]